MKEGQSEEPKALPRTVILDPGFNTDDIFLLINTAKKHLRLVIDVKTTCSLQSQ